MSKNNENLLYLFELLDIACRYQAEEFAKFIGSKLYGLFDLQSALNKNLNLKIHIKNVFNLLEERLAIVDALLLEAKHPSATDEQRKIGSLLKEPSAWSYICKDQTGQNSTGAFAIKFCTI